MGNQQVAEEILQTLGVWRVLIPGSVSVEERGDKVNPAA